MVVRMTAVRKTVARLVRNNAHEWGLNMRRRVIKVLGVLLMAGSTTQIAAAAGHHAREGAGAHRHDATVSRCSRFAELGLNSARAAGAFGASGRGHKVR